MKSRAEELLESVSTARGAPVLERTRHPAAQRRGEALAALRAELLGEMAAALGRAETRVRRSLARIAHVAREIDALERRHGSGPADRAALAARIDAFNTERGVAEHRLWELTVQREALGLRCHDVLRDFYPIPARRRAPTD